MSGLTFAHDCIIVVALVWQVTIQCKISTASGLLCEIASLVSYTSEFLEHFSNISQQDIEMRG